MIKQSAIDKFLDDLASQNATPGGGSVAAIIGAMGAALVAMVCNLTIGKKKYAGVEAEMRALLERAEALRHRLTGMIEDDVKAFDAVMGAYGMPKETDAEKASRSAAIQEALKLATDVPLRCCHAAREVIDPLIPSSTTVVARAHRRHVEHLTNWRTTAPDATPSFELAALEGVGRDADQRSDLFAAHAAELGQERDQRAGQHWSDSRHGSEQPVSMGERCIGSHNLGQMAVEHVDIGCEPSDATARKPLQHCIFQQSGGILGGDFLGTELTAHGEHLSQPFDRRRARLRRLCRHDGDERGDHTSVERIVLGQNPTGPCELPQLERVDLACRHVGRKQGSHRAAFVPSARLQTDCRDREAAQPFDQFGPTGCVIAYREALLLRQHHDVQTILRHIDSANRLHLRIPFLLMRARAQATVRVWKKRPELQAHSRFGIRNGCGLPVATRVRS
jgi:hypothetical protein